MLESADTWLPEQGLLPDPSHPDVKEIIDAAGPYYVVTAKRGLTLTLIPSGASHFRRGTWFVSFNPPDLYYPGQWFWEASGSDGMVFNRQQHGPRAGTLFAEHLISLRPPAPIVLPPAPLAGA